MSKDKISDYSETPGNNTDIGGINIAEGMLPSDVNNAIREQMAQLKKFQSGTSGESVTFVTANVTTANAGQVNVDNLRLDGNTLSSTNTNGNVELNPNGTGRVTTSALSATSPRVITAINDTNGNELFGVTATGSAVNEFTVANAATGNAPTLSATGGDTNIGMALTPKGTGGVIFPAGAVGTPAITTTGDLNTGIFFPAADTIAFTEGGVEAMRIDSSGNVGIGTTSPSTQMELAKNNTAGTALNVLRFTDTDTVASANQPMGTIEFFTSDATEPGVGAAIRGLGGTAGVSSAKLAFNVGGVEAMRIQGGNLGIGTSSPQEKLHVVSSVVSGTTYNADDKFVVENNGTCNINMISNTTGANFLLFSDTTRSRGSVGYDHTGDYMRFSTAGSERMRIDSSGNVGIGTTSPTFADGKGIQLYNSAGSARIRVTNNTTGATTSDGAEFTVAGSDLYIINYENATTQFWTNNTERARITSGGDFLVGTTVVASSAVSGVTLGNTGYAYIARSGAAPLFVNRRTNNGDLVIFERDGTPEGSISVSGNTVSYNAFCGGHWTQLQEGRGYNPDIPRGTVMSSIGEMAVWKSVEWTENIEHPAVEAVEAKEAVLDEDGNVLEPAVEAVEGKDAWTETFNKRESYLGNLDIGETFEEDGFTKTVVDDGNERLPKVKISDVVGDKAVYGVFQTWDDVEDMLITSLGAFVVRIAAGVTVEIGDLLESNGDGCAKVQDDDIIRSKTIGKVTSTVATDTYDDGSYTVPCVIYCG